MIQYFGDSRDRFFEQMRKRLRAILEEDRRYWKDPDKSSVMWVEYLERFCDAPQGFKEWLKSHPEVPDAETITRRRREVIEQIRLEEKEKFKELSEADGTPTREFAERIL